MAAINADPLAIADGLVLTFECHHEENSVYEHHPYDISESGLGQYNMAKVSAGINAS
jgi:hypothetical protein